MKPSRKYKSWYFERTYFWCTSLAVTGDDQYIVSGSEDCTIRVWNFLNIKQETVLVGHLSDITSVSVTTDNKYNHSH